MKILMSGGNGLLGTCLKKIEPSIISLSRSDMDVFDYDQIVKQMKIIKPDIFLHLAAFTNNRELVKNPIKAIHDNIIGTANVVLACIEENVKLVYLSTDYVYSGKKGMYKEEDELLPVNKYAWSKLGGECAVIQYDNSLIIRTSFDPSIFPYEKAFVDMWTSKDSVDLIAPLILQATKSSLIGIVNVGTQRKNMFQYANKKNKNVKKSIRNEFGDSTDFDTSLDISKFESFFN